MSDTNSSLEVTSSPEKSSTNTSDTLEIHDQNNSTNKFKWFFAVISLTCITIFCGTPNLFPSQRLEIMNYFEFSGGQATFFLTGGSFLMYFSLPCGIFMDKFGTTLTYFISLIITSITFICKFIIIIHT